ncbi:hypothetical protein LXM94_23665 [Rhizobium sp. TRM95111]|uniref:hypothetical protein n=1 Tax=Rhizobium alarense TaxID=2846851 RepID=UPI001F386B42|nr:hypothetical protein [Rhizobium alarense]MCF3642965.1 hypothetical protein [Rhizobium alarense]
MLLLILVGASVELPDGVLALPRMLIMIERVAPVVCENGQQKDREELRRRLEAGEEIEFAEALAVLDVRSTRDLWPFAELHALGRVGSPLEAQSEIPPAAWPHLTWEMKGIDFVVVTPEGKRVYDMRFRTRSVAETVPGAVLSASFAPDDRSGPSEEPAQVFRRIVETPRAEGRPWTIGDYNAELVRAGLSVTADKWRVPGLTVSQGRVERGAGPTALYRALVVARFRFAADRGDFEQCRTRRDVVRVLCGWLAVEHANLDIVRRSGFPDVKTVDGLSDFLRANIGDFAGGSASCTHTYPLPQTVP